MKAQLEILGLVVIVVLFILGGLIYLFFASKPPDTSLSETRESAEVSNLLDSMMKLNPCVSTSDSFSDILKSCYLYSGNSDYCGTPLCKDYIADVFHNVTRAYNSQAQYSFVVAAPGATFISDGSCDLPRKMSSDRALRFGSSSLHVILTVCSK